MNIQETKKLIDNVIENEFEHIQEYKEVDDLNKDQVRKEQAEKVSKLFSDLLDSIPKEYAKQVENFYDQVIHEWSCYCRYYFKEGVRAGITNLNFLEDVKAMTLI